MIRCRRCHGKGVIMAPVLPQSQPVDLALPPAGLPAEPKIEFVRSPCPECKGLRSDQGPR